MNAIGFINIHATSNGILIEQHDRNDLMCTSLCLLILIIDFLPSFEGDKDAVEPSGFRLIKL